MSLKEKIISEMIIPDSEILERDRIYKEILTEHPELVKVYGGDVGFRRRFLDLYWNFKKEEISK